MSTVDDTLERYRSARSEFYGYRAEASTVEMVGLSLGFAALTGLAAQVRIPLPFTPVPITGQTFAVLLTGVVLGARWGGLSQGLYVGLGTAGVPWFTGWSGGIGVLKGPTGGYIVGFVAAAIAVGWAVERFEWARTLPGLTAVLLVANFGIIYAFGLPWLAGFLALVEGASLTVMEVLKLGLLPYIPGDLVKLGAAVAVARIVGPVGDGPAAE